jgi:hypothetical protein
VDNAREQDLITDNTTIDPAQVELETGDVTVDSNAGDDGSQPSEVESTTTPKKQPSPRLIQRFGTLTAQREAAEKEAAKLAEKNRILEEHNKLLQLQTEQVNGPTSGPLSKRDPEKFDEGVYDPKYQTALTEYNKADIENSVMQRTQEALAKHQQELAQAEQLAALKQQRLDAQKSAQNLGLGDYHENEAAAQEILGVEAVNGIIGNYDDSAAQLINYLGSAEGELDAVEIKEMLDSNQAIRALRKVSQVEAQLLSNGNGGNTATTTRKPLPLPPPDKPAHGNIVADPPRKSGVVDNNDDALISGAVFS